MSLYHQHGYKKHQQPTASTFTYASEVERRVRRHMLIGAISLLIVACIGMGLIMIHLIAITPQVRP